MPLNLKSGLLTPPPELTLFLYYFGKSLYISFLPNYCYYKACHYLRGDNCSFSLNQTRISNHCNESRIVNEIEEYSSYLLLVAQLVYTSLAIPATFLSGPLSDTFGRKPILITAIFASVASALCFCMVEIFNLPPYYIVLCSLLDGIFGNHMVVQVGVAAMSIDRSTERARTQRMGVLEGTLLLANVCAHLVSGYIISALGFLGTFMLLALAWSLALIYVRYIPESHIPEEKPVFTYSEIKHLVNKALTPLRLFKTNKNRLRFVVVLIAYIFFIEDIVSVRSVFSLYVLAPPLCWGPKDQGLYFGLLYLCRLIGVFVVLPFLLLCRVSDLLLLLIGAVDCGIVFGLTGANRSTWWLLGVVPASGFLASLGVPSIRSGLSKLVLPTERGSMLTILEVFNSITAVFSIIFFNALYPTLRMTNASYIFYIVSATSIVPCSVVVSLMVYECSKNRTQKGTVSSENEPLLRGPIN